MSRSTKSSRVTKVPKYQDSSDSESESDSETSEYKTSIYIFHRALRLNDNLGLIEALNNSENVLPIFIFTPEQITDKNKFRSVPAIRFMIDSLIDLDKNLKRIGSKLRFFYGEQHKVLEQILKEDGNRLNIEALYVNMDYTPYAIEREDKLASVCDKYNIDMYSIEDYLMLPINSVLTGSNTYYSVYTPFYNKAVKIKIPKPINSRKRNFLSNRTRIKSEVKLSTIPSKFGFKSSLSSIGLKCWPGNRNHALKRVRDIKNHKKYADNRNDLTMCTTRLSPYIKFGLVSPREVYHKIKDLFNTKHTLISQLFWREFYYNLTYNAPQVLEGDSFRDKYDKIKWKKNSRLLEKWKTGKTGVPIVDAGMRELVATNYMHNRSRLITSNYLVKHYFIDWREGEKFYAKHLVDYDPAVNNGNWQWTSGSGADAQPYFRLMNPWSQLKKFDPDCKYVKKWIPELKDVSSEDIIKWHEVHENYPDVDYPAPAKVYDYHALKKESKKVYSL